MHPMSIPVNCDQQLAVCDDHRVAAAPSRARQRRGITKLSHFGAILHHASSDRSSQ